MLMLSVKTMASLYVVVTITTNFVISVVGTIGNVLLILAYVRCRDIRTIPNVFNLVTFAIGVVICSVNYPLQGLLDAFVIRQNPGCIVVLSLAFFSGICFTLNVLALTVERYISICHSLHAPTILTKRRVAIALGAIFVYAAFFGLFIPLATPLGYKGYVDPRVGCRLFVIIQKDYVAFIFTNFLSPILPMIVIYGRIFVVLRRHIRAVVDLSAIRPSAGMNNQTEASTEAANRERIRWKREMKSAVFLFILIISFIINFLPFIIFVLTATFTFKSLVSPVVFSFSHALVYSTAAINPYLYGFGNKAFRRAVLSLFGKRRKASNDLTLSVNTASSVAGK